MITGLDPTGGGPPVALEGLVRAQLRLGHRVGVVSTFRAGDDLSRAERMTEAGASVTLIGPTRGRLQRVPGMNGQLETLIGAEDPPAVVHVHNLWETLQHATARAARRAGVSYVIRPCGMLDPWSLRQSRLVKAAMLAFRTRRDLNGAAALHFTTDTERDLVSALGLKPTAIVEPNGVDLPPAGPASQGRELRSHLGLEPSGGPLVVFLSRLHPKKGVDVLLDAFERVVAGWPPDRDPPTLLIAGPDEAGTLAKLREQLRGLQSRDRVRFLGLVLGEDKQRLLAGADLFVLPSHQENFGIAVVEALAAGTPVVISDQVNVYEEIVSAGVGEATPVRADAVAAAVSAWLLDDPRRLAAASRAAGWAASRFDWNRIAARWAGHYTRLNGGAA